MKRSIIIFFGALAIFMAGCTGDVIAPVPERSPEGDRAWVTDLSLPVPIELGISKAITDTKGNGLVNSLEDMDRKHFRIFGADKHSSSISLMDGMKAVDAYFFYNDGERFKFGNYNEGDSEDRTIYYPSDDVDYTFYAYHDPTNPEEGEPKYWTEDEDKRLMVEVLLGKTTDVLWGKAESGESEGFNASYIRLSRNKPGFVFRHPAVCLSISASLADTFSSDTKYILVGGLKLKSIATTANLCLIDANESGSLEGTICATDNFKDVNLYNLPDGTSGNLNMKFVNSEANLHKVIGGNMFIAPQQGAIECTLMVQRWSEGAPRADGTWYLDLTLDPALINPVFEEYRYQAGKRYRFNIEIGLMNRAVPYIKSVGISNASM